MRFLIRTKQIFFVESRVQYLKNSRDYHPIVSRLLYQPPKSPETKALKGHKLCNCLALHYLPECCFRVLEKKHKRLTGILCLR